MANKYYVKHKEKLRKEAHGRYQNLSRDKKGQKCLKQISRSF